MKVICEVSNRHYHPGRNNTRIFTKKRDLSQTGQWVANERVTAEGIEFAVIMPEREQEKYELSITDWRRLFGAALEPDFAGVPFTIQTRHFHCDPMTAGQLGLQDGDMISLYKDGPRAGRLDQVRVRIDPSFQPRVHLDTDEANALLIANGDEVELIIEKK